MDEFYSPLSNFPPQAGERADVEGIYQDEHDGKGGSYVIENGKRVLQERTDMPPRKDGAPAEPVKTTKSKVKGASND